MAQKSLLGLLFISLSLMMFAHLHKVDAKRGPVVVVGGYTPADPKDPEIVKMGKFAVTKHNKKAVDDELKFVTVTKAETQLVAGISYRMTISAKDNKSGKIITYRAVVWSKPWEHFLQLVSFEKVRDRPLMGGWSEIEDLSGAEVVKVGKYAVEEHNKESGSRLKYVGIIWGEGQVVAGFNRRLIVIAKEKTTGKTKAYKTLVFLGLGNEDNMELRSFEEIQG